MLLRNNKIVGSLGEHFVNENNLDFEQKNFLIGLIDLLYELTEPTRKLYEDPVDQNNPWSKESIYAQLQDLVDINELIDPIYLEKFKKKMEAKIITHIQKHQREVLTIGKHGYTRLHNIPQEDQLLWC